MRFYGKQICGYLLAFSLTLAFLNALFYSKISNRLFSRLFNSRPKPNRNQILLYKRYNTKHWSDYKQFNQSDRRKFDQLAQKLEATFKNGGNKNVFINHTSAIQRLNSTEKLEPIRNVALVKTHKVLLLSLFTST